MEIMIFISMMTTTTKPLTPKRNKIINMAKLKNKYKREEKELIDSMLKSGNKTFITRIELIETSKIKGHQIYECKYVDGGVKKQVNIIAADITDAVSKLEALVGFGMPQQAANLMLGSEKFNLDK